MNDLKFAFRQLLKNPGFTAVAVLTLALGIGATTTIFSVVNGVLLRPLPYAEADRIVSVYERNPRLGFESANVSPANYLDWREQNRVFEEIAFVGEFAASRSFILTGQEQAQRLRGRFVSASFFPVFGIQPMLGRPFIPEEDKPGGSLAVVLSHGGWQRLFASDPNIIGRTISLDSLNRRRAFAVVGVMPPGFEYPGNCELWVSASAITSFTMTRRPGHQLNIVARLKPGVTIEQAQAEMNVIQGRMEQKYPNLQLGSHVNMVPLRDYFVGSVRKALWVFLGAVIFVLLIACANVANLLLARASARQKEMAVRAALGASRLRIIRQLLTESALLSVLGMGLGMVLAFWGRKLLLSFNAGVPRTSEIQIDGTVLLFAALVSLLTGLLFGLAPALQASRHDVNEALKGVGPGTTEARERRRLRSALVVAESALALMLLVGAGLMIQSFVRLQREEPGFRVDNLLVADIDMASSAHPHDQARRHFFRQLVERLKSIPGVQSVCGTAMIPLQGTGWSVKFQIEGRPRLADDQLLAHDLRVITPGYFQTLGIRLLKGREFTESDASASGRVIIVNETLARHYFPNEDPIGRRLEFDGTFCQVVGLVADVKNAGLHGAVRPEIYGNYLQWFFPSAYVMVRTSSNPMGLVPILRDEVKALNKDQPVAWIFTMDKWMAGGLAQPRFRSLLLGVFGAAALLLAAVGIYGVMSYSVAQRTHEMGVRMALGAQKADVLVLVLKQGLLLALLGAASGIAGSLALTRVLASQLFGVSPTDAMTFASVATLLVLVALLACYLPARRATKVDPMEALRYE
jgi:putative ABC transport system permease protein